jgi:hypothetical protein
MSSEEMSNLNLVRYFRDQLEQLAAGAAPREILSWSERRILRRNGILVNRRGRGVTIADLGQRLLTLLAQRRGGGV